jgi:YjzC-like protein
LLFHNNSFNAPRLNGDNKIVQEKEGQKNMGQSRHFKSGQKAPNNGVYVEIGDTESNVNNPKKIKLKAGDRFPETSNDERVWTYQHKP